MICEDASPCVATSLSDNVSQIEKAIRETGDGPFIGKVLFPKITNSQQGV